MLYSLVKALSLPPAVLVMALAAALIIAQRRRRTGLALAWAVVIVFYLLSAPFSASRLAARVATVPPLSPTADISSAQAIVVLSAGGDAYAPEYGGLMLDGTTVERLRYAAHLYHRTPLPVLVSGGVIRGVPSALADAMKQALEQDFAVPVTWVENRSGDTEENARYSAAMLKAAGISSIVLVTHASHMPRALRLFEATGLKVLPAPTGFSTSATYFPAGFIPRMWAFVDSEAAIYEILGRLWHGLY
jgi:uncharacterized SAM-binding protein YcdF (DUF218 family)